MINIEINPFIPSLEIPVIEVITEFTNNEVTASYKYEAEKHSRLYISVAKRDLIYSTLSMYARDLLLLIMYITNFEYDYTVLTFEKVSENINKKDIKYGKRRFEETVRELIRFAILSCKDKDKGYYWYNPNYFCSGNRINMFPNNIKVILTKVDSNVNRINN